MRMRTNLFGSAMVLLLGAPFTAQAQGQSDIARVDLRGTWRYSTAGGKYSDTFQISAQNPNGTFSGRFADTPVSGNSPISGHLTSTGIEFTRTILPVNQKQVWTAQLSGSSGNLRMINGISSGYPGGGRWDFHAEKIAGSPAAGSGASTVPYGAQTTGRGPMAVISGRITEWVGGAPGVSPRRQGLAGVRVLVVVGWRNLIEHPGGLDVLDCDRIVADTTTDVQGRYTVNVPPGTYDVQLWKQYYIPANNDGIGAPGTYNADLMKSTPLGGGFHQQLSLHP